MSKITLDPIGSGYNLSKMNDNFERIATVINDKMLSRSPEGEPNHMDDVLDMNSNPIINLPQPSSATEPVRLQDIPDLVNQAQGANYIGEEPPVSPFNGLRWYKPSEATTFVYYVDGDSGQWVQEPVVSADSTLELQLAAADSTVLVGGVQAGVVGKSITRVTPEMFGAVAGLNANNHLALRAMILDGRPVDWGSKTYGCTDTILDGHSITHAIDWVSSGCVVYLDPLAVHRNRFVYGIIEPLEHRIVGKLTFDASSKSANSLQLFNNSELSYPSGYGSLYADGLTLKNTRRTVGSVGGSGFELRGKFKSVVLDNLVVDTVAMEAGAGVEGSQGVFGIGVNRASEIYGGGYSLYTEINNPQVSSVFSEDANYVFDQDGVIVFGQLTADTPISSFCVNGGTFRNCYGRSIKGQTSTGKVSGTRFERTTGVTGGVGGQPEIDFQLGNGSVERISCYYENNVPRCIVAQQNSNFDNNTGSGASDGITVNIVGAVTLPQISENVPRQAATGSNELSNVTVQGSIERIALVRTIDDKAILSVSNINAEAITSEAFRVQAFGAGSNYNATIHAKNIVNLAASVPIAATNVPGSGANAQVSVSGKVIGFIYERRLGAGDANKPNVIHFPAIAGDYTNGGFEKMLSYPIAAGATIELPDFGYSLNVYSILLHVARFRGDVALLSTDTGGVQKIAGGATIEVGTTTEPVSGDFRLWYSGGKVQLKNATASSRVFSLKVFG